MEFKLPDIGEGVAEGEITRWLVQEGDTLTNDQPMVEVMTDKATVELPSPSVGTVGKILVKEGETVPVGTVILSINEGSASAPVSAEAPPRQAPSPVSAEAPPRQAPAPAAQAVELAGNVINFDVLATPATRKLARDLSVDLNVVKGTGPAGRVTKADVQMAYENQQAGAPRSSHPVPTGLESVRSTLTSVPHGAVQTIPLRGIRKKIAEAMAHSKRTAAHFTFVEEVDMTEVYNMRKASKAEADRRGVKLTFLPFIIKALIPALREFPYLNASLNDEAQEILLKGDYNLGIATDTPNGLMVPNIKDADRKNIWELAAEITELSEKARTGKSDISELKGGTFTITNAGSLGGVMATPVINHPEVAILGVNAIRRRPMVKPDSDEIWIRHMMYFALSVDHRVVDGGDAARFMNQLVYYLNDPKRMIFA